MTPTGPLPLVVALDMGYGHLRAAHALAGALGTEVLLVDRPPLAEGEELLLWAACRRFYEGVSRLSQLPVVGAPLRSLLDAITDIPPLHPTATSRSPTSSAGRSAGGWPRGSAAAWRRAWRRPASRS